MPPEDNVVSTPEEPVSPELAPDDNSNSGDQQRKVLPPTAPKGKPKAPPLIHGRIRMSEADGDMSGGSGSKIPLLKTKHLETDSFGESKKRSSTYGNHASKISKVDSNLPKSSMGVHRTVEKVKLPKGIEMRRVVQESSGIKAKRYTPGVFNTKTASVSSSTKQSSQHVSNGTYRRKMTKTEASFPEVKSFSGHVRPSGSASSLPGKLKSNEGISSGPPEKTNSSQEIPLKLAATSTKITNEEITALQDPGTLAGDFKTVDEFLKMPETTLPDTKPHSPVKKTIYKSKFWEYLEPKTTNTKPSSKEHKKPYDPGEVKNFMQKQKELRKIQQQKESKEKEEEFAKRQRMLKELDSKCQRIALKGKARVNEDDVATDDKPEEILKKPKLDLQSASPSMKYLKPLLERKQGSLLRKSDSYTRDVAKQSQYLLTEFENIVKRECISFLQKIPIPPSSQTNIVSPEVEKVDKAVATSVSLLELNLNTTTSEHKQTQSDGGSEIESLEQDTSKRSAVPSPATVEKAVTKIQALYRGYKVRQALKEARIVFFHKKPAHKRCSETSQQNSPGFQNQTNVNRRWSFPRMPEKPYDNISRIIPMSPIPMVGISTKLSSVPCYIPPPPAVGQPPRSPARPRVLPSFPMTPGRVYDEPYPKQTRKSTDNLDRVNDNIPLTSTQQKGYSESDPSIKSEADVESSVHELPNVRPAAAYHAIAPTSSNRCDLDFAIPSSVPSILDVLREKLRWFSNENNVAAPSNAGVLDKESSESQVQSMKGSDEWRPGNNLGKESGDISTTTIEDHGATPKIKRHKRRSRPRSQRSPVGESSTTVDTDADYMPSATRSSASIPQRQKKTAHASSGGSKSEEIIGSSSLADPTTTSSFENFLAPALQLRYEAEREHLKIIEKALQVKLQSSVPTVGSTESIRNNEQHQQTRNEDSAKKSSPETDRVQLAIANCQKESMKAAAEMAKWMSEFQKTTREQDRVQVQQTPVDIAATVIAAVEQARIMGLEKRKGKRLTEHNKQELQMPQLLQGNAELETTSETGSSEMRSKVDKAVETSLNLVTHFKESLAEKEKKRDEVENVIVIRNLKDYQQQFPSGSERDSPVPVIRTSGNENKHGISRHYSPDGEVANDVSKFEEPIDYPSIIPSGNSVDFTSLDPRVSTLDSISSVSSEEKETTRSVSELKRISQETHIQPPPHSLPASLTESPKSEVRIPSLEVSFEKDESTTDKQTSIIEEDISQSRDNDEEHHLTSVHTNSQVSSLAENISEKSQFEDYYSEHSQVVDETSDRSRLDKSISEHSQRLASVALAAASTTEEEPQIADAVTSKPEFEVPLKPPPPYSPVASSIESPNSEVGIPSLEISSSEKGESTADKQISVIKDAPNSEVGIPSLEISSPEKEESTTEQQKSIIKEDHDLENDEDHHPISVHTSSQQSSVAENISEKSQFEDDENSEHSQIIDEVSERSRLDENISEHSKIAIAQSLADEALATASVNEEEPEIVEDVVTITPESEIPSKPPPTYSPPASSTEAPNSEAIIPSLEVSFEKDESTTERQKSIITEEDNSKNQDNDEEHHPTTSVHTNSQHSSLAENISEKSQFEEDDSKHSQVIDETSEKSRLEESISEHSQRLANVALAAAITTEEEPEIGSTKPEVEIPLKPPPPPYSPPASSSESPNSEVRIPSLEISSSEKEESTAEKQTSIINEDKSQNLENDEDHQSPSVHPNSESSLAENVSEKSQFEDDYSEQSQVIDETSDKSRLDENISENSKIAIAQSLENEALAATSATLEEPEIADVGPTKPEFEIPLKPPPPYSPSSSLESTSLSSRSLMVSLPDDKLEKITREQADIIWELCKSGDGNQDQFPDMSSVMNVMYEKQLAKKDVVETTDANANGNIQTAAEHSFDSLLCHLIYETMKEVLQVKSNFTSFIERVRPGPLSLQAQKLKIPKTKDALVAAVLTRVLKIIPSTFFSDFHATERDKPKLRKWCSRPRELVDEILLEELVEEDYQWTEWWPEEVIISHHISTKITQNLIRNALQKRKYVYSQSQ